MDEVLYKRDFSQPYLRCLNLDESLYVLRDVHEGACGNHSRARSLVYKMVYVGYYCPSMKADAKTYVKSCDKCQGTTIYLGNHQSIILQWWPLGPLPSGDLTSLVPFL